MAKKTPKSVGTPLVPAGSLTPTPVEARSSPFIVEALQSVIGEMERELGGRQRLLEVLAKHPSGSAAMELVRLLADPDHKRTSLLQLCLLVGMTTGDLLRAYREGVLAYAQGLSMLEVAASLPAVTKDVMARAQPHDQTCGSCQGTGTVVPDPTKKDPNPLPKPCESCRGTGKIHILPDLDRQKLALDLGDLLPKKGGPLVQVNQQTHVGGGSAGLLGAGSLERMQQAVSQILYGSKRTLDVDPIRQEPEPPEFP